MYLHSLIADLPSAERASLVQCCTLRFYKRNETVVTMDEWTDQIYCVANGLLRVVTPGHGSGAEVTTDFIRQDDFFLGPSFNEDRYQTVQTLVAALPSSVYLVPISAIRRLCETYPAVTLGLLGFAMKRLTMIRGQLRRISALSSEDLISRVLHQLTQLAPTSTGGYDKRITQTVIASYTGLSREVVNKTMRDLEERGLVRRDAHGLHVPAEFASTDFASSLPLSDMHLDLRRGDGVPAARARPMLEHSPQLP
jgi:CRP/FNR family cyclic AMP-dependent transcriptional regulator